MKSEIKLLIFLIVLLLTYHVQGQCLNTESNPSNTGGYFDSNSGIREYWWTPSLNSTYTIDTEDYYYGNSALKVVVSPEDDYTNNLARMWTKSGDCTLSINNGQSWNVSLYIKGEIGDQLQFVLIDADNSNADLGNISHKIQYSGWHFVRLKISSSGATTNGKLRINFQSQGIYRLDNIVLEQEAAFDEFYVDEVVNNGDGSINSPFNSLDNAIRYNSNFDPGDLVHVKTGTYKNRNWDGDNDGINDNNNPYLALNSSDFLDSKNGTINRPIVIRNYVDESGNHDTPKIIFDGRGGFQLGSNSNPITNVEVAGFKIQGPNDSITYSEAKSNRDSAVSNKINNGITAVQNNFYHGRGIAIWGGSYVNIHNNEVWDCPNSGIRVNNSDYVRINNNKVYDNTWWAYNAESAIVMAQSRNRDADQTATKIKMRIENNIVYNNINKLPFFNPNYDCDSATSTSYGCGGQNEIIDGSGCYITRNSYDADDTSGSNPNYSSDGLFYGTFLFANNVAYNNGMNGVVVHKTDYAKVYNNTVYKNGEVPSESDEDWGSYGVDWKDALAVGRQKYTGIVINSSSNVEIYNNISWAKNSDDMAYVKYKASNWTSSNVKWGNNLAGNGTLISSNNISSQDFTQTDPLFVDPTNANLTLKDFSLMESSPAIDSGNATYAMAYDINDTPKPQGLSDDLGAYEFGSNTWNGATDSDWQTPTNWSRNSLPSAADQIIIPDVTNQPQISNSDGSNGNVTLEDITINTSAELSINKGASLSLTGNFVNNGSVTLNSESNEFSSLIVEGNSSGTISYTRNLDTSNWYLIGSPFVGQDVDDFVASQGLATSGTNNALGTYNTTDDTWSYYQTGTSNSDELGSGEGYAVSLNTASGAITFSGTMKTDATSVSLTTTGNGYNLLGNPYPSYMDSAALLSGSSDALSSETIWVWNQSTGEYETKVTVDGFQISPSQAFFVQSDGSAGSITMNESFQSSQTNGTSQRTEERPEIILTLIDKATPQSTKLYYITETTTGFDNGFDGPMFDGVSNAFSIYTHTVENGTGRDLAIQSLPDNNYDNMVVPIGINAEAGTEINISARAINLPEGTDVYLEDKEKESLTLLSSSSNFTTTLSADSKGVGRFYLHTKTKPLGDEGEIFSSGDLSLYDSSSHNLSVLGILQGKAKARIYDILGNQVVNTVFEGNRTNHIPLPNLAVGVYIVHLTTESETLIKKIIIR